MLSEIAVALQKYKELTVLQRQAIIEEDTEKISSLIAEKDQLINMIKKHITPDLKQEVVEVLREEVLAIVDIEQANIKNLKQAQRQIRKNIQDAKNRQDAFVSYSKNLGKK